MGLIVPYESRVPIQNANNPGPVARQRNASEFLSLNDKMLAPALRDLSQGLGQLGRAIHAEQVRKNEEKLQLDMINDLQAFRAGSQKYIDDYQRDYQGRDALNAEQDYLAWNKEQADTLKKKYAGNAWAMQQLAQQGGNIAISGVNSMRDYGNQQLSAYREQTFQGLQAQTSSLITADPANWQGAVDQMVSNFEAMYPGAAPEFVTAKRDEFTAAGLSAAFNAAVARGEMKLARSIMEQAYTARPATGIQGGGSGLGAAGGQPAKVPKGAGPYLGIVGKASATYGVPANIILAVMQTESSFKSGAVSPTGVKGLMQVTSATYKGLGFTGDRSDPENSVNAGTKLLGQLFKQYGNWEHAFAAYNGGPDAVRGLKTGNWGVWAGNAAKQREIRNYAPTVMQNLQAMGEAPAQVANQAKAGNDRPVDPSLATGEPVVVASLDPGIPAGSFQAGDSPASGPDGDQFIADPLAAGAPNNNVEGTPDGLLEQGNIDLNNRPVVQNDDGTISTVRTISVNLEGQEVLIPTVADDGRIMPEDEAVKQYQETGRHFGKFDTPEHATEFAERLHEQQANQYGQGKDSAPPALQYGGLVPHSTLQQMQKVFSQAEDTRIKDLRKAANDQMGQADMSGILTHEMVMNDPYLSREEKLGWLKVADGEAGLQGYVKTHQKEALEDVLYVARQTGDINSKADLDHFYASKKAWDLFDRKDYERHLKDIEAGDKDLDGIIKQFLTMNPDSFSGKDTKIKADQELFKISAMKLIRQRRLTARNDPDQIQDLLTDWLKDDRYKKADGVDQLPGAYADKPGAMDTLIQERIHRGGYVDTPFNQARAREAIEKAIPMREVMAPDAESWAGKGLMTLFDADSSFPTTWLANKVADFFTKSSSIRIHKALFEEAGNSYNVDPNLLAALAYVASGGDKYATSALKPGAVGLMQLNPETGASLGAADLTDPRQSIFAAANAMDQLMTFYEGNTKAALAAYAGVLDEKETTDFINEVLRVYNKNYGLAEMGPRVDQQYASPRYVRPGDRK